MVVRRVRPVKKRKAAVGEGGTVAVYLHTSTMKKPAVARASLGPNPSFLQYPADRRSRPRVAQLRQLSDESECSPQPSLSLALRALAPFDASEVPYQRDQECASLACRQRGLSGSVTGPARDLGLE